MIYLFVVGALVCVIALFVTLSVGKEVNQTILKRKSETREQEVRNQLERSRSYEQSFGNVKKLLFIYAATFAVALILLILFVF
ncbi:MAG TPA: hypothetical protein VFK27_02610 [Bacillales bacterium]|nr:hypothetical protein [Bacillales bacterium]